MRAALLAPLIAAAVLATPIAATAADLDEPRYGGHLESPYDDPRYRELYGEPEPPPHRYAEPRPDWGSRGSYKDEGYLAPMQPPPPPRYAAAPPYGRDPGCLSRREVHERLTSGGWSGFHDIEVRGEVARVKAYRPSGRLFDLDVDRCDGRILGARQLSGPERPYAWRGHGYDGRRY